MAMVPVRAPPLTIVLPYILVSTIYIYASDYLLELFVTEIGLLTKIQTFKGLGFILITSAFLYVLVKRHLARTDSHYREIIDVMHTADHQLRRSEQEYLSLFNHSPVPTWIFDLHTLEFLLVNEEAEQLYGYSQEEFMRMTIRDIRPPEDIVVLERIVSSSTAEERSSFPDLIRHKTKSGAIIQVMIESTSVTFQGRKARLISAIDITQQLNVQNKLIESNAKLQQASDLADLGYWTNDLVTAQIQWSDKLYKIFDATPENFELSLDNIMAHFHSGDPIDNEGEFMNLFEHNKIRESERRIITDSGKIKWILERQYLTKDNNGAPIKLEGIALDITNRKLYEQEVWESNERFKILARATIEAIIDWDIQSDRVIWGEGFQTLFGYDLSIYDNHLWSNNIHPDDREQVMTDLNKTVQDPNKEFFNAEFRFLKADRTIVYVQHRGIFIRDANGKAIRALGAMTDITDALERLHKLELQNKALTDIAWTQSHLVRAPLANLLGLTDILKNNLHKEISQTEIINHLYNSAQQLDAVIHDIVKKTNEDKYRTIGFGYYPLQQ